MESREQQGESEVYAQGTSGNEIRQEMSDLWLSSAVALQKSIWS